MKKVGFSAVRGAARQVHDIDAVYLRSKNVKFKLHLRKKSQEKEYVALHCFAGQGGNRAKENIVENDEPINTPNKFGPGIESLLQKARVKSDKLSRI